MCPYTNAMALIDMTHSRQVDLSITFHDVSCSRGDFEIRFDGLPARIGWAPDMRYSTWKTGRRTSQRECQRNFHRFRTRTIFRNARRKIRLLSL